jgi:hypothetical protein
MLRWPFLTLARPVASVAVLSRRPLAPIAAAGRAVSGRACVGAHLIALGRGSFAAIVVVRRRAHSVANLIASGRGSFAAIVVV